MTNSNCSPIPTIPFLDPTFLAPEVTKLSTRHVHDMQSTAEGTDQNSSSHNRTILIKHLKTNNKVHFPKPALGTVTTEHKLIYADKFYLETKGNKVNLFP